VLDVDEELDGVAAGPTAVAEVHVAAGRDGERGGLLVVERAEALEVAPAGRLQRDVLGDDVGDRSAFADQRDVLVSDAASHAVHPASRS
jgi:hypothetical protein